ncbi:MAG: LytR family transcriptional regulator [Clostridia bacterium]|jgi:LCP family protein required for cell wall assembly|nr:LytR family transcriptional regulator [Clostridia bacterium]
MFKKDKKKMKNSTKVVLTILVVIVLVIACVLGYIYSKISKINFEAIDKNDLEVNKNIYDEISNTISKIEFNNVKSVVFFGIDTRDTEGGYSGRSDTIMVASINPQNKGVSLVSIPRDTYVNIPGYGKDKINHSYAFGKEQLAIKTINSNFGLNLTEYVTIDFVGLIHVINKLGGIELNITNEELSYINNHSKNSYDMTGNKIKMLTSSGLVTLSGEQALTHSRNRTVGNDFTRASRQRTVIEAIINKLSSLGINDIMSVSDSILSEVKTNINVTEYMGILSKVISEKNTYLKNIVSAQIPSVDYSEGKMINSVYYFTTDYVKAKADFIKYIYGN